jgi:hypothetical protein
VGKVSSKREGKGRQKTPEEQSFYTVFKKYISLKLSQHPWTSCCNFKKEMR